MSISKKNEKLVWGKAAARCAMCKIFLVHEGAEAQATIGEIAHIEGEREGSARYNQNMTDGERNGYTNLVLLCPNHHTEIDRDISKYTISTLRNIKSDHEVWVSRALESALPEVTFAEIDVAVKYLIGNSPQNVDEDISFIPPKEKIDKNGLSVEVANLITFGMSRVKQVKEFLNTNPDINFAQRLKDGLVLKYNQLREEGATSDEIFHQLLAYASGNSIEMKVNAAALAVIVYFFEVCDIFEK